MINNINNLTYDHKLNLNKHGYDTVDMSVKVVLDQLEHKTRITKKWDPIRDGNIFTNYLKAKDKISEIDKENLIKSSVGLLGKCINPSVHEDVKLNSTGMCFGQIQSGKTTSMEAVFSLAADNNFKILILLTGSVGPLAEQNTSRLDLILEDRKFQIMKNVGNEWKHDDFLQDLKSNIESWNDPTIPENDQRTMVFLSMKNPTRIKKIIKLFDEACNGDYNKINKIPTIIVDDECDHHSLNAKANKNDIDLKDEEELYIIQQGDTLEKIAEKYDLTLDELYEVNPGEENENRLDNLSSHIGESININLIGTATHFTITGLRKVFGFHSFVGYTATPNANLVVNTFNHLSPSFAEVIKPGSLYTGLEYFFSTEERVERFVENISENLIQYEDNNNECPPSLRDAYLYFLTSVSCAKIMGKDSTEKKENMSMIIHPSGKIASHNKYLKWIYELNKDFKDIIEKKNLDTDRFDNLILEIKNIIAKIKKQSSNPDIPQYDDNFLVKLKTSLNINPISFNRADGKRIPEVNYRNNYANILVGGFGLDRGYTVEGLTVTYLCRPLGTRQEDTIMQRARFMGYQKKNEDFLKLYFTQDTAEFFTGEYDRNSNLMRSLTNHINSGKDLRDWRRVWFGRDRSKFKLTRNNITNNFNFVSRNKPYKGSIRSGYSHLLSDESQNINKKIYEGIKKSIKLDDLRLEKNKQILKDNPWVSGQNIILIEDIKLSEVFEKIINNMDYETRDYDKFSQVIEMISIYLYPFRIKGQSEEDHKNLLKQRSEKKCPILIFRDGDKSKRTQQHPNKRISTQEGQSSDFSSNSDNRNIFPGDINIHYDFLKRLTNDAIPVITPSIQLHTINVAKSKDDQSIIAENVPYLSFFMPSELFTEIKVANRKS